MSCCQPWWLPSIRRMTAVFFLQQFQHFSSCFFFRWSELHDPIFSMESSCHFGIPGTGLGRWWLPPRCSESSDVTAGHQHWWEKRPPLLWKVEIWEGNTPEISTELRPFDSCIMFIPSTFHIFLLIHPLFLLNLGFLDFCSTSIDSSSSPGLETNAIPAPISFAATTAPSIRMAGTAIDRCRRSWRSILERMAIVAEPIWAPNGWSWCWFISWKMP